MLTACSDGIGRPEFPDIIGGRIDVFAYYLRKTRVGKTITRLEIRTGCIYKRGLGSQWGARNIIGYIDIVKGIPAGILYQEINRRIRFQAIILRMLISRAAVQGIIRRPVIHLPPEFDIVGAAQWRRRVRTAYIDGYFLTVAKQLEVLR